MPPISVVYDPAVFGEFYDFLATKPILSVESQVECCYLQRAMDPVVDGVEEYILWCVAEDARDLDEAHERSNEALAALAPLYALVADHVADPRFTEIYDDLMSQLRRMHVHLAALTAGAHTLPDIDNRGGFAQYAGVPIA